MKKSSSEIASGIIYVLIDCKRPNYGKEKRTHIQKNIQIPYGRKVLPAI